MTKPENVGGKDVSIGQFQSLIKTMYFEKDQARGIPATFLWLTEEIGELASALRETEAAAELAKEHSDPKLVADFAAKHQNLGEEFADVFAWLATIANVAEVDLPKVLFEKYGAGCPGCEQFRCSCPDAEKP
jgi:NTP pyrophosphatase (non-canonical NTP hydrolase)